MSDPTTTNRSLAIPTHGSDVNSWDVPLNGNFGLLDTIAGGLAAISTTGGSTALPANVLQCGTIRVSGALGSTAQIVFPAVDGWWTIHNLTTGSPVLQVVAGGGTQVIALPPGVMTDIQVSGNSVFFRNLHPTIGGYWDIAKGTVPLWVNSCTLRPFLNCDGSTFSGTTYPYLAEFLGGTTLPDLRGIVRGTLNQGTGRMTSASGGVDGNTLFAIGGSDSQPLSVAQLPTGIPLNLSAELTAGNAVTAVQGNVASAASPVPGSVLLGANNTTRTSINSPVTGTVTVTGTADGNATNHTTMQPTTVGGITLIRAG